jgi:pyridoxal phosphate enzyme (YggS family)
MNAEKLRRNVESVRRRVADACRVMNRDPSSLTLVVVTKDRPVEAIRELYELGVKDLGESRVQEASEKRPSLPAGAGGPRWHMIGHLQTNKVRRAVELFDVIHSVDRPSLAQELHRHLASRGRTIDAFVQVNVAGEAQKGGIPPDQVLPFVDDIRDRCSTLRLQGLMTMAPLSDEPERVRWVFARLRELAVQVGLPGLSMGMTQDYVVAIEEGATHLRIGSAFFEGVFE